MPLTDAAIRNAKPRGKPVKLFDGHGMYLLANSNGSKWWCLKYRYTGRERLLNEVTTPELLAVLRRVESRGTLETAQRLKIKCGEVFRYAIATGRAGQDPTAAAQYLDERRRMMQAWADYLDGLKAEANVIPLRR